MDLLIALAGLAILVGAGDLLVRGAVALSLRFGVPALIVSLTVVAFGTSAPELLIAVEAALEGAPGIAYGSVVGSNIANVLLVLGAPALISTLDGRRSAAGRSYLQMMAVSAAFVALCWAGPLDWPHGLALLAMLAAMLADAYVRARSARRDVRAAAQGGGAAAGAEVDGDGNLLAELIEDDPIIAGVDPADAATAPVRIAIFLAIGLIGLPLGAQLLIDGARGVALAMGVSEAAIGLTLVAVGTSLPELATTVAAALRRQAEVALGNVIGSNLFNLGGVMGVAAFFGPLPLPPGFPEFDLWVMLAASVVLAPFACGHARMGRWVGAGMIAAYVGYAAVALAP